MSSTFIPEFKWAENFDNIYLTIILPVAVQSKVDWTDSEVKFSGTQEGKQWALDLKLNKKIDPAKSTWSAKARDVEFLLSKAAGSKGWWNQLLSDKNAYKGRVKINWDLWHDEDEEKEMPQSFGGGGGGMNFNPAAMNNGMDFSSMMGTNNDDEPDSDNEELPDLEASKDRDAKSAKREEEV